MEFSPSEDMFQDKIILVTGAGEGMGAAVAKQLALHGATVILLGPQVAQLEATFDAISDAGCPQAAIYPLDLATANPDQYRECIETIRASFGRLDGLIHNASHLGKLTPIELYDIKAWYEVLQTNLNAPFLLTQAAIPLLKLSKSASVIFTTDDTAKKGKAYWGAFCVTGFGKEALSQVLSEELESCQVRVNCVNPGPVQSALRSKAYPAESKAALPQCEDLASAYLYLMSDESKTVSGQSLNAQSFGMEHA